MSPLIGYQRPAPVNKLDRLHRLHGHLEYLRSYFTDLPEPVIVALDNLIDVIKENKK